MSNFTYNNGGLWTLGKHTLLCGIIFEIGPGIVQLHKDHLGHNLIVGTHLLKKSFVIMNYSI